MLEGFSALLKKAQSDRRIKGVSFGSTSPHITHHLFADDSVVFLEGTQGNLHSQKNILQANQVASGQKVNLQNHLCFLGKDLMRMISAL